MTLFQYYNDERMGTSDPDPEPDRHLPTIVTKPILTEQEKKIVKLISLGHPNKIIASELEITEQTVKNHVTSILYKLEASNRTHAVTLAVQKGII